MTLLAAFAISHQRMHGFIGDAELSAVRVGTGVSLGSDLLIPAPTALALPPGLHLSPDRLDGQLHT